MIAIAQFKYALGRYPIHIRRFGLTGSVISERNSVSIKFRDCYLGFNIVSETSNNFKSFFSTI